jgi:hypothetical protein
MFLPESSRRAISSLAFVVVALIFFIQANLALGAAKLDRLLNGKFYVSDISPADDCAMFELFDQIARTANIPLGFENVQGCGFGRRTIVPNDQRSILAASTPREAFDEVAALNRNFRWREIDGMIIVRPADAWENSANLLNLPARPFQVMNVDADDALYRVLEAATPRVSYVQSRKQALGSRATPVSVDFSGGSLLRALNAVVRAKGDAEWRVGYSSGEAAILIGKLSKLSEPAVGYVSRIVWKTSSLPGPIAN